MAHVGRLRVTCDDTPATPATRSLHQRMPSLPLEAPPRVSGRNWTSELGLTGPWCPESRPSPRPRVNETGELPQVPSAGAGSWLCTPLQGGGRQDRPRPSPCVIDLISMVLGMRSSELGGCTDFRLILDLKRVLIKVDFPKPLCPGGRRGRRPASSQGVHRPATPQCLGITPSTPPWGAPVRESQAVVTLPQCMVGPPPLSTGVQPPPAGPMAPSRKGLDAEHVRVRGKAPRVPTQDPRERARLPHGGRSVNRPQASHAGRPRCWAPVQPGAGLPASGLSREGRAGPACSLDRQPRRKVAGSLLPGAKGLGLLGVGGSPRGLQARVRVGARGTLWQKLGREAAGQSPTFPRARPASPPGGSNGGSGRSEELEPQAGTGVHSTGPPAPPPAGRAVAPRYREAGRDSPTTMMLNSKPCFMAFRRICSRMESMPT